MAGHIGVRPELLVLATGTGSLIFSQVNDPGFWMIQTFFKLEIKETFATWTLLETVLSVTGLVATLAFVRGNALNSCFFTRAGFTLQLHSAAYPKSAVLPCNRPSLSGKAIHAYASSSLWPPSQASPFAQPDNPLPRSRPNLSIPTTPARLPQNCSLPPAASTTPAAKP